MTEDGSDWVKLVTGAMDEAKDMDALTKSRIKHVLQAELLTQGMRRELIESNALSITFPDGTDPSVRICLNFDHATEEDKRFLDKFIAQRTENSWTLTHSGTADFHNLMDQGVYVDRGGSVDMYHGRCDSIISAPSADMLVQAIGTMVTNPLIKKQFLAAGANVIG